MITAGELYAADTRRCRSPRTSRLPGSGGPAAYFVEYVKQQLIDDVRRRPRSSAAGSR